MSKRILSLALALFLTLALVPAAFAAEMPDGVYSWNDGTTFVYTVVTPHEYLGEVRFGNLWWNTGEPCDWRFSVFIVDDSITSLTIHAYLTKQPTPFRLNFGDGLVTGGPENGKVYLGTELYSGEDLAMTKEDPMTFRFRPGKGWFDEPTKFYYAYDENDEEIGFFDYSAIVFTKSQLAEFKASGKLPPMYYFEADESDLDITELKALLLGTAPTLVTPEPSTPATGSTAALKTTDGLYSAIPPAPVAVTSDVQYKVAKGDSLAAIAKKYGTNVDKIKADNKTYFDNLAERNKKQGTKVALEADVTLIIKTVTETKDLAYTVQKGESLHGIAFNYYGSMSNDAVSKIKTANKAYFDDLAARNKKNKTSVTLEAGAILTLPAKGLINPVTQGSLDKAAGMYLVKSGDTLGAIAKIYYGDANQWKKIQEANKDRVRVIDGSPMIYTGQWLVIPE